MVHDPCCGVVLVSSHGDADHGHARRQRLDRRAVAAVRHDHGRVGQDLRVGSRAYDGDVGGRSHLVGIEQPAHRDDGADRQGRQRLDHAAQHGTLVLVRGAEPDQDERALVGPRPRRGPGLHPVGVVEDGAHVPDVGRDRTGRVVEDGAGQHQDQVCRQCLVVERGQRGEAVPRSGAVDRRQTGPKEAVDHPPQGGVAGPAEHGLGEREAGADRRGAGGRHDPDVRHDKRHGELGGLGGDDRTEQKGVGHHHVGPEFLDGGGGVGRELGGGPGDEPVAHPLQHYERVRRLPVLQEILGRIECPLVRSPSPGGERAPGRLGAGTNGRVGEDVHVVPPLDQPSGDTELGSDIAPALPRRHQEAISLSVHHVRPRFCPLSWKCDPLHAAAPRWSAPAQCSC